MAGYGDDAGFNAWVSANGYTLPESAPAAAVLRERGSAYIDGAYGMRFAGAPTGGFEQERAWPRTGASAYGQAIGDAVVPSLVVAASYVAAWQEASTPGSLSAFGSPATAVKREKVEGAVEVEYQGNSGVWSAVNLAPVLTAVEGLLAPFLMPVGGIPTAMVV
ncbi:hypothetical protein GCM10011321_14690 [Youhaiella tibetensis]|uniref:Uncharacterized protein n=1 Tax=Paradevosia tibetensis TaxID=1447062 RepID=A0A5B9DNC9_9HYPH|nr:DnaT-like ssDNA-binding protein [Youhaiella tibetensis]QEE20415.1 hypothetical protein FNA67_09610 [Youhaiella tibetensis]GGF24368.1 hypothetical protein GCM10011321_14690 [Youhaiella tibetensis]